jgi:uncharacterized membrane protein YfcA
MDIGLAILCLAGFLGGFIDSVAGGGGLVTLPALLAAGVPAHIALGTNKLQSMCGTTCALLNFHRHAKVLWRIAAVGVPFSLAGSAAGARLALVIPPSILAKVLVIILPPAAFFMFTSRHLIKPTYGERRTGAAFWVPTIVACSTIGLYDGFFGPGTGTFLILALVLFSKIPLINATATAKTFNLASNVAAFITFAMSGSIDYTIGLAMAACNIAGNLIGSHYAIKHGHEFIRKLLMVAVTLLFAYLVWKYYL